MTYQIKQFLEDVKPVQGFEICNKLVKNGYENIIEDGYNLYGPQQMRRWLTYSSVNAQRLLSLGLPDTTSVEDAYEFLLINLPKTNEVTVEIWNRDNVLATIKYIKVCAGIETV